MWSALLSAVLFWCRWCTLKKLVPELPTLLKSQRNCQRTWNLLLDVLELIGCIVIRYEWCLELLSLFPRQNSLSALTLSVYEGRVCSGFPCWQECSCGDNDIQWEVSLLQSAGSWSIVPEFVSMCSLPLSNEGSLRYIFIINLIVSLFVVYRWVCWIKLNCKIHLVLNFVETSCLYLFWFFSFEAVLV